MNESLVEAAQVLSPNDPWQPRDNGGKDANGVKDTGAMKTSVPKRTKINGLAFE